MDAINCLILGRLAGGQVGRRAGGQVGRRSGGQAGRRAGGQAEHCIPSGRNVSLVAIITNPTSLQALVRSNV
jgi:hypothetical protein